MQDDGTDNPHDNAKDKDTNCKDSIIDGGFLDPGVSSTEVLPENQKGDEQRDTGDDEDSNLRPLHLVRSPWSHLLTANIAGWDSLSSVEDGQDGSEHSQDNERA